MGCWISIQRPIFHPFVEDHQPARPPASPPASDRPPIAACTPLPRLPRHSPSAHPQSSPHATTTPPAAVPHLSPVAAPCHDDHHPPPPQPPARPQLEAGLRGIRWPWVIGSALCAALYIYIHTQEIFYIHISESILYVHRLHQHRRAASCNICHAYIQHLYPAIGFSARHTLLFFFHLPN